MPQEPDYKRLLLNLLAIIHRDGGHYTGEHGVEKSVKDATQRVCDDRVYKEEINGKEEDSSVGAG